jgi:uncharacterized protein YndB with AHSA1/START domain
MPLVHDTFVLRRRYPKSPERVFRAFADPAQKRRWYADGAGHEALSYGMTFEVGGDEHSRYTMGPGTPVAGKELASASRFLDIVPDTRVVSAQTMSLDGRSISAALITIELLPDGDGTDLTLTHQAAFFEGSDGPQMRRGGWESLLDRLGQALA